MEPIFTIDLFPKIDKKLLEVLRSLSPDDWQKQTLAPLWKVHDVALHLLDGNIRTLSLLRDGYMGVKPTVISTYEDLVAYLNQLNADWILAMRRLSPALLVDLLEHTGQQYTHYLAQLDPFAPATFSVAWAGESTSPNWFHIAREYTEKWHHQQQIRLAVGQEAALYTPEYYRPYLDTSMRALPHHYRTVKGSDQEAIKFSVSGEGGGVWYLQSNGQAWVLKAAIDTEPICEVQIDGQIAWRIFTKGITKQAAAEGLVIKGRQDLGLKIVDMLAVMA